MDKECERYMEEQFERGDRISIAVALAFGTAIVGFLILVFGFFIFSIFSPFFGEGEKAAFGIAMLAFFPVALLFWLWRGFRTKAKG